MRKKNKFLALLCVATIATASLAGCGNNAGTSKEQEVSEEKKSSTDEKTSESESSVAKENETTSEDPVEILPITEEEITLKVAVPVPAKVEDINTNKLTLYIEEQTGINLEFVELSQTDVATQVNTIMNGGDLPDVFIGYHFEYDALCSYADAGLLQPLDEYIDKWGYNLKNTMLADKAWNSDGNALSYATYDGKVWAVPNGGVMVTNHYAAEAPYLQTYFLDELDMEFPKTLDQLRDFLETVKENYPDVVPMTSYAGKNLIFANISQAFQYTDMGTYMKISDGKIEFIGNNELFKEAIEYTKAMVDDGLIDPAAFTQDQSVLSTQLGKEGYNAAVVAAGNQSTGVMDSNGDEYANMKILGVIEGPHGYAATKVGVTGKRCSMVMTSACKYPEEAFRLFDFFLSDDFAIKARVGFEGEQWEKAADGVIGRDGEQAWFTLLKTQEILEPSTNVLWCLESFIHSNIMNHCEASAGTSKYPVATEIVEQKLIDLDSGEQVPIFVMAVEDQAEYNELKTLITDKITSNVSQFILGTRDLSEFDDYCAELEAMGLERYVEMANEAYAAMKQ